jgi:hypothetical protein
MSNSGRSTKWMRSHLTPRKSKYQDVNSQPTNKHVKICPVSKCDAMKAYRRRADIF